MSDSIRSTIQKRDEAGRIRHGGEWLSIWSDPDSLKSPEELRLQQDERAAFGSARDMIAAAARSIAGNPALPIRFVTHGRIETEAPESTGGTHMVLHGPAPDLSDLPAARGEGDSAAARLRFSDTALHTRLRPAEKRAARLFDLAETARCDALAVALYPGMRGNLVAHHHAALAKAHLLDAHLASLLPLSEGLRMVLRDMLTDAMDASIQTAGMRMWDQWLRARYGRQLERLRASIADQEAFAREAIALNDSLIAELPSMGRAMRHAQSEDADSGTSEPAEPEDENDDTTAGGEDWVETDEGIALFGDDEDSPLIHDPESHQPRKRAAYRAFTTRHDRIVRAEDLADRATLRALRAALLERRGDMRRALARLAAQLQKRLIAKRAHDWEFNLEEGLIDSARIEQIVLDPAFSHFYKQEAEAPVRDTVVTLLIDNSGSMRGKPIEIAAMTAELLSTALERAGIANEVLGFTTSGWKGGKSMRDWAEAGRPPDPGRLNDTLHIIYKAANAPLSHARNGMFAMLVPGVLKENIDGEALRWAAERLMQRPEARKLLIVLSDGAPADEATLENNSDADLLHRDLQDAIRTVSRNPVIELSAIGIGHDVRSFYPRAIRIDHAEDLGETLIGQLDQLLVREG